MNLCEGFPNEGYSMNFDEAEQRLEESGKKKIYLKALYILCQGYLAANNQLDFKAKGIAIDQEKKQQVSSASWWSPVFGSSSKKYHATQICAELDQLCKINKRYASLQEAVTLLFKKSLLDEVSSDSVKDVCDIICARLHEYDKYGE